jgi:hypothetical protein
VRDGERRIPPRINPGEASKEQVILGLVIRL